MTTSAWLWIVGLVLVAIGLIYATKKGWVSWRGGSGIATLTVFHDLQPRDKQEAVEFVMDRKAGKRLEADESGEGDRSPDPGQDPPIPPKEPLL